jgi:group I intron endonuclease
MGWIYLIKNKVNGKCYVGQTRQKKVESRWAYHRNAHVTNTSYLANAIRAHGWESFETAVICEIPNEELDDREILEIRERNTLAPNGYNLDGGGGVNKLVHLDTREKMRQSQLGRKHPEEVKLKIGSSQIGELNHMYGKVFTEEHRNKLRQAARKSGYDHSKMAEDDKPNKKEVNQYTTGWDFLKTHESISKAAEEMGVDRTTIGNCCRGKSKTSCGFIWKYKDPEIYVINQYTLDGIFIKSFENIKNAAEMTESSQSSVGGCCNGRTHTSNGFIWKRELKTAEVL